MQWPKTASTANDGGSYVFVTSTDPYMGRAVYDWSEISGNTANKLTFTGNYHASASYTIPWSFRFYSITTTTFNVCTAGMLMIPQGYYTTCPSGQYGGAYYEWPTIYPNSYAIAGHGAQLWIDPAVSDAGVYHETQGSPGSYVEVFQWNKMKYCTSWTTSPAYTCATGAGELTFQVKLFQGTNRIETHYKTMDLTGVPTSHQDSYGYYSATVQGITAEGTNYCYTGCAMGIGYRFSRQYYTYDYSCWCYRTVNPPIASYYCYYYYRCENFGTDTVPFAIAYFKNTAPKGASITATVNEDVATHIQLQGADPEGRPLQAKLNGASLVTVQPKNGTVTVVDPCSPAPATCTPGFGNGNGYLRYTSKANWNGVDSFSFQVSDGAMKDTATYTATITVRPINDRPVGKGDTIQVWDNPYLTSIPASEGVLVNDLDAEITQGEGPNGLAPPFFPMQKLQVDLGAGRVTPPTQTSPGGSFAMQADGSFTYKPKPGYSGTDTLRYYPCDDNDQSTRHGTLATPPTNVPDPPAQSCDTISTSVTLQVRRFSLRALSDDFTVVEDVPLVATPQKGLGANDAGMANATKLVITSVPSPKHGNLVAANDGSFTYTPVANVCDTPGGKADVYSYHLEDGQGSTRRGNTVTATFHIVCVDDPGNFNANATYYKFKLNPEPVNDRFWATLPSTSTAYSYAQGKYVPVPSSILPGPCTTLSGAVNECTTQKMRFEVTNDNPDLFKVQPKVSAYVSDEFRTAPSWYNPAVFRPTYGWLNFTIAKDASGAAQISVCLVDDGVEKGTADGPGSNPRFCRAVTVSVPGPPRIGPDSYVAYKGHQLVVPAATGILANDVNSSKVGNPQANIRARMFAPPAHAIQFAMKDDGSFSYTPDPAFVGEDSFLYTAYDDLYSSLTPGRVAIDVREALPPGADFQWTPQEPVAGQVVRYADTSGVPGAYVVAWSWDFGDGTSSAEQDPTHTYRAPGTYQVRLSIVDSKGDRAVITKTVTVAGANPRTAGIEAPTVAPPVANAGPDFSAPEMSVVHLMGAVTPASPSTSVTWRQVAGPKVELSSPRELSTSFQAPSAKPYMPERLTFELSAFDGLHDSAPSRVTVTVLSGNHAPVAQAGAPQSGRAGMRVPLDGSGTTDPDGDALTYRWRQVSGVPVELGDETSARAWFVAPPSDTRLEVSFELEASDGINPPSSDLTVVTIEPAAPSVPFTFQVAGALRPGLVSFRGGDEATSWDFGDGAGGMGADPVHTYSASGTYLVTMMGPSGTHQQAVDVALPNLAAASANQASAAGLVASLALLGAAAVLARRRS